MTCFFPADRILFHSFPALEHWKFEHKNVMSDLSTNVSRLTIKFYNWVKYCTIWDQKPSCYGVLMRCIQFANCKNYWAAIIVNCVQCMQDWKTRNSRHQLLSAQALSKDMFFFYLWVTIEVGLGHCLLEKCFWSPACILLTELHQLAIVDDVTTLFDHMIPKYLTSI